MMNLKKMINLFLIFFLMLLLTGCQLAKEEENPVTDKDRLIGVFITTEYLDLFDAEEFLNDHGDDVLDGDIVIEDGSDYGQRIYARLQTKEHTDIDTGQTIKSSEYVFDEVDGIPFFAARINLGTDQGYLSSGAGEGLSDVHTAIQSGDKKESLELTGTIYYSLQAKGSPVFYLNPVYQDANGNVYLSSGTGVSFENNMEGISTTQTMEETVTLVENGIDKEIGTKISVSITVVYAPESIHLLQMDADHNILSHTEYLPREMPETLTVEKGTEYILVESHQQDLDGNPSTIRTIYESEEEYLETRYCKDDGICITQGTRLEWEKQK